MSDDILTYSAQQIYDHGRGSMFDRSFVKQRADEVRELLESAGYITAWHKTSHRLKDIIEEDGLLPRERSGMPSRDANPGKELNPESHQDKVYFTVLDGGTYDGADAATVHKLGGRPMQVKAHLNTDNLTADEDSGYEDWVNSLLMNGTVAYQGSIGPSKEVNEDAWISEINVGEDLGVPIPVLNYLAEQENAHELVDQVKPRYDTQLGRFEAAWLTEHNRERGRTDNTYDPQAMKIKGELRKETKETEPNQEEIDVDQLLEDIDENK